MHLDRQMGRETDVSDPYMSVCLCRWAQKLNKSLSLAGQLSEFQGKPGKCFEKSVKRNGMLSLRHV